MATDYEAPTFGRASDVAEVADTQSAEGQG
jgi:hypothetical protein